MDTTINIIMIIEEVLKINNIMKIIITKVIKAKVKEDIMAKNKIIIKKVDIIIIQKKKTNIIMKKKEAIEKSKITRSNITMQKNNKMKARNKLLQ